MVSEEVVAEMSLVVGPANVRHLSSDLALYSRDASTIDGSAGLVILPGAHDEVVKIVQVCARYNIPFVARGAGTGLAGGATPLDGAIVISLMRMNRILSVDAVNRLAWVEPGVLNLDLSRHTHGHHLHFAPDPSSQQSCTIGGNVANNSGGPHCLAEGVTASHVMAAEVVLSDGSVVLLGGEDPEPYGPDLRGTFVGSEGMFGIATKICVRLTPNPPSVSTMLLDFDSVKAGADTVGAIIASGIVPAALEMMDQLCLRVVEDYIGAGLPTESAAALLVEVDGLPHSVAHQTEQIVAIGEAHGAKSVRVAADENERALLWKGRKTAFGAIARIKPNYYLHDTVVPRRELPKVLDGIYDIAKRHDLMVVNVFHAGDGNLHPLLVFDRREEGALERVHSAGEDIVKLSLAHGGVLSGEHGIGLEKRDYMTLQFTSADLEAQSRLRRAFDPLALANPQKVLPSPSTCGDSFAIGDELWV